MGGVQAAEVCFVGDRRLRAFAIPFESVPPSVCHSARVAPGGPTLRRLSSPRVAVLGRPSPWPCALRRGRCAALGTREARGKSRGAGPWVGRVRQRVGLGVCCRGGGAKIPFVFPIRCQCWTFHEDIWYICAMSVRSKGKASEVRDQ